jgi:hypothetical protein
MPVCASMAPSSQHISASSSSDCSLQLDRPPGLLARVEPCPYVGVVETHVTAEPDARDRTGPCRLQHPCLRNRQEVGDLVGGQETVSHNRGRSSCARPRESCTNYRCAKRSSSSSPIGGCVTRDFEPRLARLPSLVCDTAARAHDGAGRRCRAWLGGGGLAGCAVVFVSGGCRPGHDIQGLL